MRMKPASFAITSRRPLSSLALSTYRCSTFSVAPKKPTLLVRPRLQQSFRRNYADEAAPKAPEVTLSPTPKPKRRFKWLVYLWRITYLSASAGVGYLAYSIWDLRNPNEQFDPDPSKKTLVVLGKKNMCPELLAHC